jgi:carboxypeptidase C (cathepsin A)
MLFEQQANTLQLNTYVDEAKNYTLNISNFLKNNLDVKLYLLTGTNDFVTYYKAIRSWAETELTFVESAAFQKLDLTVIWIVTQNVTINGTVQARTKAVKQVAYSEVINSGHYLFEDKPYVTNYLIQQWIAGKTET